jgi:site-specific DNA-methyltransferase (adenine-specific)
MTPKQEHRKKKTKAQLFRDNFQNFKGYHIPKAQLVIADIPYNIGINAYGSNPSWYKGGDRKNGESALAGKAFFNGDHNFNVYEFFHFASKLLVKEPKERGKAPCMIVFCSFEQQFPLIELGNRHGFKNYINLIFRKNFSAQVLKANMRVVGNAEYGLLFYRDKLPKFNNNGKMVFNIIDWEKDKKNKLHDKIHPTQKPVKLLEKLITIFTDEGEVVIDPVAGSASTLIAAQNLGRRGYGFEIIKDFYNQGSKWIEKTWTVKEEITEHGFSNTLMQIKNPKQNTLFSRSKP